MAKVHTGKKKGKSKKKKNPDTKCAEHGKWAAPPPPSWWPLNFATIDDAENARVTAAGAMTFTMVGCTGEPGAAAPDSNTRAVATAMVTAGGSSFFYHLGDITYTASESASESSSDEPADDQYPLWNEQFYGPYSTYPKQIVSIAGNHDGKLSTNPQTSQLGNYLANFCADPQAWPAKWAQNTKYSRPAMIQPHVYWRFDTPLAYIIGLYSNVANGGILDQPDPNVPFTAGPQYQWLVSQLQAVAAENAAATTKKAILLAVHYPPYSGAANFNVRGDQSQGPTKNAKHAPYLAVALQQAFADAKQRPDVIVSAHAHLFQRLTYTFADKTVMPCLIAGCGGHTPLEDMAATCSGGTASPYPPTPFIVTPGKFTFPENESAVVNYYEDHSSNQGHGLFGFLEVTIKGRTLSGTFVTTAGQSPDKFCLDLDTHQYIG